MTPVGERLVGVAMLGPAGLDIDRVARRHARRSPSAWPAPTRQGPVRGAGPLRQRTSARTAGRVLLVGDASGYVDALTGEGLRVGFAQAAAAIAHLDDPAAYERAWARATGTTEPSRPASWPPRRRPLRPRRRAGRRRQRHGCSARWSSASRSEPLSLPADDEGRPACAERPCDLLLHLSG